MHLTINSGQKCLPVLCNSTTSLVVFSAALLFKERLLTSSSKPKKTKVEAIQSFKSNFY